MGLLKRFFRSPEELAKELVADDSKLITIWQEYVDSTKEKGRLIEALKPGTALPALLSSLKGVIASELVKTTQEEKTEKELIADLNALAHEEHVKRVKRLEHTIGFETTKHLYVHQLLEELWKALNNELHIVEKLISGSQNETLLIQKLNELWHVEQHILKLISERSTFHELFSNLMKGEHIIARLTPSQKRAITLMDGKLGAEKGLLREWVNKVYVGISDAVSNALAQGELTSQWDGDYEFVNSPAFFDLVRTSLLSIRKRKQEASERSVIVFVHLFREWYNSRLKL